MEGLPENTESVSTYYRIKESGNEFRSDFLSAPDPLNQLGISFSKDQSGTLEFKALAFSAGSPCMQASGSAELGLSGKYLQNMSVGMTAKNRGGPPITDCAISGPELPLTFPTRIALWVSPRGVVWLAGDQGLVLRGRSNVYERVPLPAELDGQKPVWRDIAGVDEDNIWIVGDAGQVVRMTPTGTLARVPLTSSLNTPLTEVPPDWQTVSVASASRILIAGTNGRFGVYDGVGNVRTAPISMTNAYPLNSAPVTSTPTNTLNESYCLNDKDCWVVGDKGLIIRAYYNDVTLQFEYYNYSMYQNTPTMNYTTQPLRGVWGYLDTSDPNTQRYIYIVGDNRTALRSNDSYLGYPANDPRLFPNFIDFSKAPTVSNNAFLVNIHGTSRNDVYVAGAGGALYKWNFTPGPVTYMDPQSKMNIDPFAPLVTGSLANLRSIFVTSRGYYVSGDQKTLLYHQFN